MPSKAVRVRFAPSPTGHLHPGTARIAVLNWLFSRRYQGEFLVRFEDTDVERSEEKFVDAILSDLGWLGIVPDEPPVFQSQRLDLYAKYLEVLRDKDMAYPCFCTDDELKVEREKSMARGRPPRYSGKCRDLSLDEVEHRALASKPSYRIRVPKGGNKFEDILRGELEFPESAFDDFIVMRSSGVASYNFAVVVDDHEMGISHVIRGEDHLSNTARQQVVINALGLNAPQYLHVGLVVGPGGAKLSKRDGAVALSALRDQDMSPEAVLNYLALLGWSSAAGEEIFTRDVLFASFEWERLSTSPGRWDPDKLRWVSGQHFRRMDPLNLAEAAIKCAKGRNLEAPWPLEWWLEIVTVFQGELYDVGQLVDQAAQYNGVLSYSDEVAIRFFDPLVQRVIRSLLADLEAHDDVGAAEAQVLVDRVKKKFGDQGIGAGKVLLPLRLALTGKKSGPELRHCISLLGRDNAIERLRGALGAARERTGNG